MDIIAKKHVFIFLIFFSAVNALAQSTSDGDPSTPVIKSTENTPDRLPKWELGLGLTTVYLNDYPGSDQQHFRWLPIPYVVYRGDFLRTDGQGKVRGMFFSGAEIDIDASVDGSFPVDDSQNRARQGMPSLDWIGEVGPRALFHVFKNTKMSVDISLPVRWVFSTNWGRLDDRGWDFNPEIKFLHKVPFDKNGGIHAAVGWLWGTSQLTRYFYEVRPEYALSDRPEYTAKPGYMYDYWALTYFHESSLFDHLMYFIGVNKFYLSGASNRSSPLMRDIENESYFLGVVYNFYRSAQLATPHVDTERASF